MKPFRKIAESLDQQEGRADGIMARLIKSPYTARIVAGIVVVVAIVWVVTRFL